MSLEVITGTGPEYDAAIACPPIDPDQPASKGITDYYEKNLTEQSEAQAEVVSFQSVTPLPRQSDNFNVIGNILHTILAFMEIHDYPRTIRIVCDTEEIARLYKVVYNFWFATEKDNRLQDNSWD